jgi:hypothetical protein
MGCARECGLAVRGRRARSFSGAALASRGAPWRPGAALASHGAGDALRAVGKLLSVTSHDWLRLRVHSAGPSSHSPQPNRRLRASMDYSSSVAHTPTCSAHNLVCAWLRTFLTAHAALRHIGVWHVKGGCCCCHVPDACQRGLQGPCIGMGPFVDYLQDRALIIYNLGPTVGQ